MDDHEFLDAFHRGSLPSSEFRHKGHLRLTWLVLRSHLPDEAASILTREIRHIAAAQGAAGRYHETLTRFWIRIVNHAIKNAGETRSLDDLLEKFPMLLDKSLPYRHWREGTFNSDKARAVWLEPDVAPLP
ncbi:hypothetical protein AUG19_04410 [archaeon 13_1_20CM_2_54_9]|nr:MAG: hypothetical protein AUJ07_09085 [Crenarchaeota archaeon 13_1_40CM_3_53_5]OLE75777.1 MAG: hypothetical protein AUG19_04410 [archaeon 13_1_20CM_2_54_9]